MPLHFLSPTHPQVHHFVVHLSVLADVYRELRTYFFAHTASLKSLQSFGFSCGELCCWFPDSIVITSCRLVKPETAHGRASDRNLECRAPSLRSLPDPSRHAAAEWCGRCSVAGCCRG